MKETTMDFQSTNLHTDSQGARHMRLLAAIIAQAVKDAWIKPSPKESEKRSNLNRDAREAIEFIFSDTSNMRALCDLIGIDATQFRKSLINPDIPRPYENNSVGGKRTKLYTSHQSRVIKARHDWYQAEQNRIAYALAMNSQSITK